MNVTRSQLRPAVIVTLAGMSALAGSNCRRSPTAETTATPPATVSDAAVARRITRDAGARDAGPRGTIEGTIFLDGPIRPGTAIVVPPAFAAHAGCRDAALRYAQPFDISTPGPMPGALASAEAHDESPGPVRDRVVTFRDCDITPRVVFARTNDRILFHSDTREQILPHIVGGQGIIDQLLIPGQADLEKHVPGAGRYPITVRNLPDWVHSTLYVLPNRFMDTTDVQGHYRITDVPVGNVTVHGWYPGTNEAREVVEVRAGETAHAEFHLHQAAEIVAPPPSRADAGPVPP